MQPMLNTFGCFSLTRVSTEFCEPIIILQLSLTNPTTFCHRILRTFSMSKILFFVAAGMLSKQRTRMPSRLSPFRSLLSTTMENGPVLHHSTTGFVASVAGQLFMRWVVFVRLHRNYLVMLLSGNITFITSVK